MQESKSRLPRKLQATGWPPYACERETSGEQGEEETKEGGATQQAHGNATSRSHTRLADDEMGDPH